MCDIELMLDKLIYEARYGMQHDTPLARRALEDARQDVIEQLNSFANDNVDLHNQILSLEEQVNQLRARIAELEEANRWIPVSDPPKKDGFILVRWEEIILPDRAYYYVDCGWELSYDYWMPIPLLPGESE